MASDMTKVFKGKNKNIWILAAVGVGIFALFMRGRGHSSGSDEGASADPALMLSGYPSGGAGNISAVNGVTQEQLNGAIDRQNDQINKHLEKIQDDYKNIFDKVHSKPKENSKPSGSTPVYSKPNYGNYLGVGGADYYKSDANTKRSIEENERKLKTDAGYRELEMEKARQVIKNRTKLGLDTKDQVEYMNHINDLHTKK